MQRFFDIILSGIAILILSPLLIIIMIVLKFTGEGEIFYRQERVGRGGHIFRVFKFATMVKNSSNMGTANAPTTGRPRGMR